MKHRILLLFLPLLLAWSARAQTTFQSQSFENSETVNYTSSAITPTATSYFFRASLPVAGYSTNAGQVSTVTGISGTFFWASENVNRTDGLPKNVTLNPVSVVGKSNLQVTVALADASGAPLNTVERWEDNDFVRIQIRFNGTGPWVTIGQFVGNVLGASGRLQLDTNRDGKSYDETSAVLTQALTDFTFLVPGSGSTMETRVEIDDDGVSEEFGFDNIRVAGSAAASAAPVLTTDAGALAYNEGDAATAISPALTVTDADNTTLSSATIQVTSNFTPSEDVLSFTGDGTTGNVAAGTFNTTTGTLALTSAGATATLAQWQSALRKVKYQSTDANDASALTRTISFGVTDPTGVSSNTATRSITVSTHLNAAVALPFIDDFETDGEGTRYASNHFVYQAGNGIVFERTNLNPRETAGNPTTFANLSNSYYWFGDNTNNSANPDPALIGQLITQPITTAGYANLHFQLRIGATPGSAGAFFQTGTSNPDYFKLYYRVGGTSGTWVLFGQFRGTGTTNASTGSMQQDTNPTSPGPLPNGTVLTTTLQNFDFTLPTAVNNGLVDFRLELKNHDAHSDFAYDLLQVTGTPLVAPTVTTAAASSVTTTSAVLGGNVTADGGATVSDRGVVYSTTNTTPTTSDTKVQIGTGTGTYSQTTASLTPGTTYYVRAYAINSVGTSYGSVVSFITTPNAPVVAAPANGSRVNTATPTYTGTAQASSTVTVYIDGTAISTTTATAGGSFALTQPTALAQGSHTVWATATIGSSVASANSNTNTFIVDTVAPTVVISSTTGASGSTNGSATFAYTVTFSESVTGFVAGDVTVGNGTLSGFAGSGTTYSFNVTPATNGAVTVNVPANVAQDAAGNGNTVSSTYTITYSQPVTAAPVVTTPGTGSLLNTATPTYAGTAVAASTVTVFVDGSAIGTTTATAGGSFSLNQPTALAEGSHTVRATAQTSGSAGSANSNTNPFTIDTGAPTVAISSSAGASGSTTSTTPIPFTVTFSESVSGFVAGDVTVTNGTLAGFAGSGSTYTFSVTPTTAGTVTTVSVPANTAQDAAGNGNTAATQFSITYVLPITLSTWTGAVSTDWFSAGNWTAGVPTSTLDAVIPTGAPRYPLVSAGTATVRSLTLSAGSSLAQSGGTLDIRSDLTNNGTFTPTGGTVVLGTTAQANGPNILGSNPIRFWNLVVQANGVLLSTPAGTSVQRILTLTGTLATQGNLFTLESDNTATALVVNNGGVVLGTATVQRAIDASLNAGPGYRHYSSPVQSTTVADLATAGFTPVVNPAYNTSATPGATVPFPTVYGYDQSRLTLTNTLTSFDKGFFSPTALSDPLAVGLGYTVNIGAGEKVDFVGMLNNGTQTLPLARNSGPTAADAGWQLLGNPYPAPLDYSLVAAADRPNLDAAIYVFGSTSQYGGQYRAYVNGIGGNPVLPVAQAFFARVSAGQTSGSLTFRNSQRLTTPNPTTFQRGTAETRPLVQLTLRGATGTASDEAYVYFEAGATAGVDAQYDAVKLPNSTGLNLASIAAGTELAINGLPLMGTTALTVPLFIGLPATGTYSLHAGLLLNFGAGAQPFLRDLQLNTLTDLSLTPDYTFTMNAANTTPRFELVFGPAQVLGTASAALAAQVAVFPNPAHAAVSVALPGSLNRKAVTATLVDALGRVVVRQVLPAGLSTHTLPLTNVATGVYALRLQTEAGMVVKKLVVE